MVLFAYVVFAILQTSFALPTNRSASPIDELTSALPLKEIQELKLKHLQSDLNFQAAIKYFKSPEWISIVEDVRSTPEWIEYKKFLHDAGLDLDALVKQMDHCVNATDDTAFKVEGVKPSVLSFLQEVKTTYGIQIIKGLQDYLEKSTKDEDAKKMRAQLVGPKSRELLDKALEQPALQKAMKKLKEVDVDVEYILQMIYAFSGWEITTTTKA